MEKWQSLWKWLRVWDIEFHLIKFNEFEATFWGLISPLESKVIEIITQLVQSTEPTRWFVQYKIRLIECGRFFNQIEFHLKSDRKIALLACQMRLKISSSNYFTHVIMLKRCLIFNPKQLELFKPKNGSSPLNISLSLH